MKPVFASLTLTGERIFLKPLTAKFATSTYASWLNDSQVNKFLETRSASIPDLVRYIKEKNDAENCFLFGIFWKITHEHIGNIKLEPVDWEKKKATIGIIIGNKDFWGLGVAPEAIKLVTNYAFETLGLISLELGVISAHLSAIRAYQKCGFKIFRKDKNALLHDKIYFDQTWMCLEKSS